MNLIETTNHILIEFMFYSTILIPHMTPLLANELVARKVIRFLEKPTAIILLNNNYINYCYTYRSVYFASLLRETSTCHRWLLTHTLTANQHVENKGQWDG